jgi:type I restriction-modification system DNA methylase subunit
MTAPETVVRLVEKFTQNREAYRSGRYNEAQLRLEFLDPFFEALGWDVTNKKGYAPDYRDVVIEDSLEIEGASKAPDYSFRIGGVRKFFVEAKKPKVDIAYDIPPAYQLRRYAWNAHLPLSILTDFEELAVYNCTNKPNPSDSAANGRDRLYRYTDYIEKWDEIAGIFSPEAILKGSFDQFAASPKGKKGTTEVDDAILADIEEWRKKLAQNIALRNESITDERQVNYAVQMTIDRILFLRICEDRGIEPDEQIKDLCAAPGIYPRLVELFRRADKKYNSGLFHFEKENGQTSAADTFTPSLVIDDKVLKEIVKDIYYPCPYIFKEIPVEILGQVYERFLGKVIHLTQGHQARIEEKPEVRKAGGVYYTPQYIVDYIVANTVGKLLEGKTPEQAASLKIVDPACGSGSFLLGAYQYLLDWHERWYEEHDPERWARGTGAPLMPSPVGRYRLTTKKRKEILVNNIHGVDIDPQAVEVTKLSLLLKVLEEESGQLSLGFERALPDLGRNIQCGNSLIGEDYFEGQLVVDEAERRRVNPFDWRSAFPQVFAKGGFDAVIGNPPYGATVSERENQYYQAKYRLKDKDTYALFIENALHLLKIFGLFSMIVPTGWYSGASYEKLRQYFITSTDPLIFVNLPYDIFNAWVDTTIFVTKKRSTITEWPRTEDSFTKIITFPKRFRIHSLADYENREKTINVVLWNANNSSEYYTYADTESLSVMRKIESCSRKLSEMADVQRGVTPFLLEANPKYPTSRNAYDGSVRRYSIEQINDKYIKYDESLAEYKPPRYFEGERLLLRELISRQFRLQAVYVNDSFITNKSMQSILSLDSRTNIKYLLGLLNSKTLSWYFLTKSNIGQRDDFPKIVLKETRELPIRTIDFANPADVKRHEQMVALVTRMLELHKRVPSTPQEAEQVAREIESTDRQIDRLVYELYGLTEDEIKIVEGS